MRTQDVPIIGQSAPAQPEDTQESADQGMPVHTAFVVYQDVDGQWVASNDPQYLSGLSINKVAHPDEMYGGASSICTDIAAQKAAIMTVQNQLAMARQAQEQQRVALQMQQMERENRR